ncbi:MAG: transporter substrate-binding domain-containing protein [Pseudodesulfovibrio sp.]
MARLRLLPILLGVLLMCASPAPAAGLIVAVPSDGCPSADLLSDLARLVVRKAGLTPQVLRLPLADIPGALGRGQANAALADPSPALRAVADNLGPVVSLKLVLVPRAATVVRSPRDLAGKTLSLYRSDACLSATVRGFGASPLPTPDTGQALRLALAGRADAALGWERTVLAWQQKERYPARALGKPIVLGVHAPCLLLAKGRSADSRRLREALTRLVRSGAVDAEAAKRLQ